MGSRRGASGRRDDGRDDRRSAGRRRQRRARGNCRDTHRDRRPGMKLEGSKILVTGASSGIGAALAPILAERGATVGIVARRADRLEAVLEQCKQFAPDSRMWAADLSDLPGAERLALEAWDAFGGLDAIVHNAAIPKRVHISRLTMDDVTETMDINFHSPVRMTLAVLPKMLEQKSGTIMWVSS